MNAKSILVAAIVAALLVAAGLFAGRDDGSAAKAATGSDQQLFEGLFDRLEQAAQIEVQSTEGSFHVELEDGQWELVESGGYPVKLDSVRKVLIDLAELETVERKTDDPARYVEIGVQAVGAAPDAETQSKQITIRDAAGETLAALIVGKTRGGGRGNSFYVRKPEEDASWLVSGERPNLPDDGETWLDKKILEVQRTDVSAARITHADGEVVTLSKEDADTNFSVHELPADRELKYDGIAGGVAGALQYLNFLGVMPAEEFEAPESQTSVANFWTKDGLRVTAQVWEKEEEVFASFQAAYDLEGTPTLALGPLPAAETPEGEESLEEEGTIEAAATPRPREEVEAEAAELNARLSPWIFKIPPYTKSNLAKRLDDLLKPLPDPEEEQDEEEAPISIDSFGGPVEESPGAEGGEGDDGEESPAPAESGDDEVPAGDGR